MPMMMKTAPPMAMLKQTRMLLASVAKAALDSLKGLDSLKTPEKTGKRNSLGVKIRT